MDGRCALRSGNSAAITPSLDGFSLPGWIYRDADFLEVEKERVFATSWQIVCHLSDIPHPGDYHTLHFLGEPLVADKGLIERVQTGMSSRSYSPGPLGRYEVSLRSFARRMRELIPESRLAQAPAAGWRSITNGLSRG
jgi:phenylpropionate dioxygenase-like ring-hydroxylating dioxygenase large terminal subunit